MKHTFTKIYFIFLFIGIIVSVGEVTNVVTLLTKMVGNETKGLNETSIDLFKADNSANEIEKIIDKFDKREFESHNEDKSNDQITCHS